MSEEIQKINEIVTTIIYISFYFRYGVLIFVMTAHGSSMLVSFMLTDEMKQDEIIT